jgi:hypothetical protein
MLVNRLKVLAVQKGSFSRVKNKLEAGLLPPLFPEASTTMERSLMFNEPTHYILRG